MITTKVTINDKVYDYNNILQYHQSEIIKQDIDLPDIDIGDINEIFCYRDDPVQVSYTFLTVDQDGYNYTNVNTDFVQGNIYMVQNDKSG